MLAGAAVMLLSGCALPSKRGMEQSSHLSLEHAVETRLGTAIHDEQQQHPGNSAVYPLIQAQDAFAARVMLIRSADKSLDLQYYIWQNDVSGQLLFKELHHAAERGVRVRLLLDDLGASGLDQSLWHLTQHPMVEVRLFNPFVQRQFKWLGFIYDFPRLHRRMHNKALIADNQFTIVGGRNIGDAYFGATDDVVFSDLDVLVAGEVVQDVSQDFDLYWNSLASYPAERLIKEPSKAPPPASTSQSARADSYKRAVQQSDFMQQLVNHELELQWVPVRMVSDSPDKVLNKGAKEKNLMPQLRAIIGQPNQQILLVTPYFVPTKAGVQAFTELAKGGIDIQILTNSLAATDVAIVHSGYAKYRKALLKAGIRLFELKRTSGSDEQKRLTKALSSSSASSLHAKTFAIDGETVFVGSFNFDPRSAHLNTELGFVVQSTELAEQMQQVFRDLLHFSAYEVKLGQGNRLYWQETTSSGTMLHSTEPESSALRRLGVRLLGMLPIEWLL